MSTSRLLVILTFPLSLSKKLPSRFLCRSHYMPLPSRVHHNDLKQFWTFSLRFFVGYRCNDVTHNKTTVLRQMCKSSLLCSPAYLSRSMAEKLHRRPTCRQLASCLVFLADDEGARTRGVPRSHA